MKNRPPVNLLKVLRAPFLVVVFLLATGFTVFQLTSTNSEAGVAPSVPLKNFGNLTTIVPDFNPDKAEYVLTAWSRSGMQMVSDANGAMTLLPPGNMLEAQLVKRGAKPKIVTEGITISYRLESELTGQDDPAVTGDEAKALSLMGNQLMGASNGLPKDAAVSGALKLGADNKSFVSKPIPVLPYTSGGSFLPYPLAVVEAKDSSGKVIAYTRAVLPVSTELGCHNCHGGSWSKNGVAGISEDTALNIMKLHDDRHNTSLIPNYEEAKEERAAGRTGVQSFGVNCRSCHNDISKGRLNISTSIHAFHSTRMGELKGADACASCHPSQRINMGKGDPAGMNTSDKPGGATYYLRDVHALKAMDCISCHGPFEDFSLGLLTQAQKEGKGHAADLAKEIKPVMIADVAAIQPRKAWVNEPDCQACHDYKVKPSSWNLAVADADVAKAAAEGKQEVKGTPISAFNKAVKEASALYINSHDQQNGLRCASCHGSPHALYPAENPYSPERDNIQPLQYQKIAAPLGASDNCTVCHVTMPDKPSVHHPLPAKDKLIVSLPKGSRQNMLGVNFPHDKHGNIDCASCHHANRTEDKVNGGYQGALKMSDVNMRCTTSGCHDSPTNVEAKPYRSFFAAFHGPDRGCLSCHVNEQAAGKTTGPIDCLACHREKVAR